VGSSTSAGKHELVSVPRILNNHLSFYAPCRTQITPGTGDTPFLSEVRSIYVRAQLFSLYLMLSFFPSPPRKGRGCQGAPAPRPRRKRGIGCTPTREARRAIQERHWILRAHPHASAARQDLRIDFTHRTTDDVLKSLTRWIWRGRISSVRYNSTAAPERLRSLVCRSAADHKC